MGKKEFYIQTLAFFFRFSFLNTLGWKIVILGNILQDVLQDHASQCFILANCLARILQEMNSHCVILAGKASNFQDICMLRLKIRGAQKSFRSIEHHY